MVAFCRFVRVKVTLYGAYLASLAPVAGHFERVPPNLNLLWGTRAPHIYQLCVPLSSRLAVMLPTGRGSHKAPPTQCTAEIRVLLKVRSSSSFRIYTTWTRDPSAWSRATTKCQLHTKP